MKRSVGLLMASVMFITMMFTGTVCYGADMDVSHGMAVWVESGNGTRSINTQTSNITLPVTLTCDGIVVVVKLGMEYSWEEGYTGWFEAGAIYKPEVEKGHTAELEPSTIDINGSYITFTIVVSVDGIKYKGTATFYVDEYGTVS